MRAFLPHTSPRTRTGLFRAAPVVVIGKEARYVRSVRATIIFLGVMVGLGCGRVGFATRDSRSDDAPPQTDGPANINHIRFRMDVAPQQVGNVVIAEPSQFSVNCGARCPASVAGRVGLAFHFDGTLRMELGQLINFAQPFTVAFWLRPDAAITGSESVVPVSKALTLGTGFNELSLILKANEFVGFEGYRAGVIAFSSTALAVRTAWHHFALVWDGTVRRLFIDGIGYDAQSGPWDFGIEPLAIGADLDNNVVRFGYAGDMDDLRIFTRAYTAAELVALMQEL